MNRRTLLRGVAVGVGGAGAGAGLVAAASDDAGAQTALALDIAGDSATLGAEESVTALTLNADIEWAYNLPDTASPATVVVELAAGTDGLTVVDSAESAQLFTESDGTESFEVDLLDTGALAATALTPESGSRETEVTIEARLRVERSDGDVLARETVSDTAPLTVERDSVDASAYGEVGGDGGLTIETE